MKKGIFVVAMLLAATTVIVAADSVSAEPLPCQYDIGTDSGYVACWVPGGSGCVSATYGDAEYRCVP